MAPANRLSEKHSALSMTSMRSILDGNVKRGAFVNVAGTAVDFQSPMATRGTDWKCTIRLLDKSTEDSLEDAITVFVFRDKDSMPRLQYGDIVVIRQVKVQLRDSEPPSLITNYNTIIRLYEGSKIPRPPSPASADLSRSSFPRKFNGTREPTLPESEYVSQLYQSLDKASLPSNNDWEVQMIASQTVRDKFSELEGIKPDTFYNIIAQVIKWHDIGDKICLWVSDYTENPAFFNHSLLGGHLSEVQEGDPYGYGAKFTKNKKDDSREPTWAGPFGKRSIQITCWNDHADAIRENRISSGDWLLLKNVQIKYGNNGANLEGFLREDKSRTGTTKVNITQLDPADDPETMDPRLKNAIRRKRDYERSKKKELKEFEEAAAAGQKRKAVSETKKKTRQRRSQRRAQAKDATALDSPKQVEAGRNDESDGEHEDPSHQRTPEAATVSIDLNQHVKCDHPTVKPSAVSEILQPLQHTVDIDGQVTHIPLPFANVNYRANVRVTNYYPADLRDFAVAKRASEFDVLSDNDDSDYASDTDWPLSPDAARIWEWRFFLELEDAGDGKGDKVWAVVDNQSAQCLTDLDAADLRKEEATLEALRERLFLLWGNLAEHKTAKENAATSRAVRRAVESDRPPLDSSDAEDEGEDGIMQRPLKVTNRPFLCCIRQYGVKVREEDELRADAGEGFRWERVYGLFGTRICAP